MPKIRNSTKQRVLVLFAILAFLISTLAASNSFFGVTEAGSACGKLGWGLNQDSVGGVFQGAANAEKESRKWTAEELFRNSVGFSTYYGEGPSTWFYADTEGRGEGRGEGYEAAKGKLQEARGCSTIDFIPNGFFLLSSLITATTGAIIMTLVGKDPMGETLMSVIAGGEGSEGGGLIQTFLNSFYLPLVIMAVLVMAITIVHKGLIQMKLREAFNSALWTLGAFVIGIALMLNPKILVGAPQAATSTITSCVMGALSGQNCLTGNVDTPAVLTGTECMSSVANGSDSESMVNSLNCTVWKSFVMEPWAEVQFGAPYKDLYTKDPPSGGSLWRALPEGDTGEKYCVNMTSTNSYETSILAGRPTMDGPKQEVCNVALYHLFLKTDMIDPVNQEGNSYSDGKIIDEGGTYDQRWYDIIIPAAGDDGSWRSWSGKGQTGAKIGTGLLGVIATIAASSVLLVLAVFAGAYKIIGLILMAFAPIFLLFAIDPNRGRRIFLGWLETLISSILKYFAITVLIIVALVMYSGMLSNTSGVMSFVGIIILTAALHMYRKEITNLIGASNMGGQRLTNKAKDIGGWGYNQAKRKSLAGVGGTVGGAIGRVKARNEEVSGRKDSIKDLQEKLKNATSEEDMAFYDEQLKKEKMLQGAAGGIVGAAVKGAVSGGLDSARRDMKRGTGAFANIMQQADRTKAAIKAEQKGRDKEAEDAKKSFDARQAEAESTAEKDLSSEAKKAEKTEKAKGRKLEDVPKEEVDVEINSAYEKFEEPSYLKDENLTAEEKDRLDEIAKAIRQGNLSDEDLLEAMKLTDAVKDPHTQELVSNEIKARVEAYNKLDIQDSALNTATALDKGLVKDPELANELNKFEAAFISSYSTKNHEEAISQYKDALYEANVDKDEVEKSAENLIKAHGERLAESRNQLMNSIESVGGEDIYNKAKDLAISKGEINNEILKESLGVSEKTAAQIISAMEIDQIVSEADIESENNHRSVILPKEKEGDSPTQDINPSSEENSETEQRMDPEEDRGKEFSRGQENFRSENEENAENKTEESEEVNSRNEEVNSRNEEFNSRNEEVNSRKVVNEKEHDSSQSENSSNNNNQNVTQTVKASSKDLESVANKMREEIQNQQREYEEYRDNNNNYTEETSQVNHQREESYRGFSEEEILMNDNSSSEVQRREQSSAEDYNYDQMLDEFMNTEESSEENESTRQAKDIDKRESSVEEKGQSVEDEIVEAVNLNGTIIDSLGDTFDMLEEEMLNERTNRTGRDRD